MSDEVRLPPPAPAGAPPPPPPAAPGNRIRPGLVVAIAVAALMLFGIVGLVGAALLGDDDEPTGDALDPVVNVDEPATAPPATGGNAASSGVGDDTAASVPGGSDASDGTDQQDSTGADDDFSGEAPTTADTVAPIETVVAVNEIEEPDENDLPEPGSVPAELPVQVTTPSPPSTFPAVQFGELDPSAVPELADWTVSDRTDDHLTLTDGDRLIEVFVVDDVATADEALEQFYDDVKPNLEELTRSPITRLGAPSSRFVSVAGSEYVATSAGQQGSSTMTGAIVAGARPDGTAFVITSSRPGTSSPDELANDANLLRAILAHL